MEFYGLVYWAERVEDFCFGGGDWLGIGEEGKVESGGRKV